MFKIIEFQCESQDCPKHFEIVEKFLLPQEINEQECETCHKKLQEVVSAPKGYVRGTSTPCKQ